MRAKKIYLTLNAAIGIATSFLANGSPVATEGHSVSVFESMMSEDNRTSCIDFDGRTNGIRFELSGVDDEAVRNLFSRIDIDVSAIGFATLADEMSRRSGEAEEYGSLPEASGKNTVKSGRDSIEADMAINEARNDIGLVSIEVERQVYHDFVHLGLDPVADLVDARSIYECHLSNPQSSAKRDLRERISASNAARSAWQKDGFSTDSASFLDAKTQDANGSEWVRKFLREQSYRNGAGLGRRDLHDIFLLVQHSGDLQLMIEALPWVANWMIEGKMSGSNYALMVDRIAIFKGMEQVYGTQGRGNDGRVTPEKMRDPAKVDVRRSLMRMRSLKEYYRALNS